MITRRTALKQALLLAGGTVLLSSCGFEKEQLALSLNNLKLEGKWQELLAEVVDAIIPGGAIPGARDLGVESFVFVMVDDCVGREEQERFSAGLKGFNGRVKKQFGKSFSKGDKAYREAVLTELMAKVEQGEESDGEVDTFLELTKRYTIMGYLKSEYVMTEHIHYEQIPVEFHSCVPVYRLGA